VHRSPLPQQQASSHNRKLKRNIDLSSTTPYLWRHQSQAPSKCRRRIMAVTEEAVAEGTTTAEEAATAADTTTPEVSKIDRPSSVPTGSRPPLPYPSFTQDSPPSCLPIRLFVCLLFARSLAGPHHHRPPAPPRGPHHRGPPGPACCVCTVM
jgi:hypothetical protein